MNERFNLYAINAYVNCKRSSYTAASINLRTVSIIVLQAAVVRDENYQRTVDRQERIFATPKMTLISNHEFHVIFSFFAGSMYYLNFNKLKYTTIFKTT